MNDSLSERIGVVGRNISAALALEALQSIGGHDYYWFQSESEVGRPTHPRWILLPQIPASQLGFEEFAVEIDDPFVMFGGHRRVSLNQFLAAKHGDHFHEALRRRCLALLLWNDLTPPLWRNEGKASAEPDYNWTAKEPLSLQRKQSFQARLLPLHHVLPHLENKLHARGVHISAPDQFVLGVKTEVRRKEIPVIHNAPYGFSAVHKLLWATVKDSLKLEHGPSQPPDLVNFATAGRWKNYGAWVSRAAVTALPTLSFWLDEHKSDKFLQTGLFESGLFKRVFVIRNDEQAPTEKVWLQIQEFEILAPKQQASTTNRSDAFLWELCPYLKNTPIVFSTFDENENYFFADPLPRWKKAASEMYLWHPGSLGSAGEAMRSWVKAPPPQKRAALLLPSA